MINLPEAKYRELEPSIERKRSSFIIFRCARRKDGARERVRRKTDDTRAILLSQRVIILTGLSRKVDHELVSKISLVKAANENSDTGAIPKLAAA